VGVTHSFAKASEGRQPARGLAALQPAVYEFCGLDWFSCGWNHRRETQLCSGSQESGPNIPPDPAFVPSQIGRAPGLAIVAEP